MNLREEEEVEFAMPQFVMLASLFRPFQSTNKTQNTLFIEQLGIQVTTMK